MLGDCGYRNLDIVTDATDGGCMTIWSKEMLYLGMLGNHVSFTGIVGMF